MAVGVEAGFEVGGGGGRESDEASAAVGGGVGQKGEVAGGWAVGVDSYECICQVPEGGTTCALCGQEEVSPEVEREVEREKQSAVAALVRRAPVALGVYVVSFVASCFVECVIRDGCCVP